MTRRKRPDNGAPAIWSARIFESSQEIGAAGYLLTARRLYQVARAAFDTSDYRRARQFAEAARDVISGLESLAQAAVPIPVPPTLP
jgi:hypothetical protein